MKNQKKRFSSLFAVSAVLSCFFLFGCCSLFNKTDVADVPYIAEGRMEIDENSGDYEIAGLNLFFMNKSEKNVSEFTVVFYLFDVDGEPISGGKSNIVLTVKESVSSMESLRCCVSLDKYFSIVPETAYAVDYFYVSRIVYENGDVWTDPFGMNAF